jgi:hypothetical protein
MLLAKCLAETYKHLSGPELLTAAIQENVLVQLDDLKTHPVWSKYAKCFGK